MYHFQSVDFFSNGKTLKKCTLDYKLCFNDDGVINLGGNAPVLDLARDYFIADAFSA